MEDSANSFSIVVYFIFFDAKQNQSFKRAHSSFPSLVPRFGDENLEHIAPTAELSFESVRAGEELINEKKKEKLFLFLKVKGVAFFSLGGSFFAFPLSVCRDSKTGSDCQARFFVLLTGSWLPRELIAESE